MDMACWGLIPKFWVKDKGFKEDDAIWGEQKIKPGEGPPEATELREGAFVAKILCDDREEEMEENMEQVSTQTYCQVNGRNVHKTKQRMTDNRQLWKFYCWTCRKFQMKMTYKIQTYPQQQVSDCGCR